MSRNKILNYGYLLHITHYDPVWCKDKSEEQAFDLSLGSEIVKEMAEAGIKMLFVDCADGVEYKSHPELKRHYTVPMSCLEELSDYARSNGVEVIPKLNFSQSRFHRHNDWMYPHNENVDGIDLFESEKYWEIGFEAIDELISACKAEKFFHVGMDEDNDRAHSQFADAIVTLRNGLHERGLQTVIWKDTRTDPRGYVFTEKQLACENKIPKDVIQMVWAYNRVVDPRIIGRLANDGINVWAATGVDADSELMAAWIDVMEKNGGNALILTDWLPCTRKFENEHFELIRKFKKALHIRGMIS
jgi:hypothetical protein